MCVRAYECVGVCVVRCFSPSVYIWRFALIRNTWKGASAVPFAFKRATIRATQQFVCFVPLATDPQADQRAGNGCACVSRYLRSCHRKRSFTPKKYIQFKRQAACWRRDRAKLALRTFFLSCVRERRLRSRAAAGAIIFDIAVTFGHCQRAINKGVATLGHTNTLAHSLIMNFPLSVESVREGRKKKGTPLTVS